MSGSPGGFFSTEAGWLFTEPTAPHVEGVGRDDYLTRASTFASQVLEDCGHPTVTPDTQSSLTRGSTAHVAWMLYAAVERARAATQHLESEVEYAAKRGSMGLDPEPVRSGAFDAFAQAFAETSALWLILQTEVRPSNGESMAGLVSIGRAQRARQKNMTDRAAEAKRSKTEPLRTAAAAFIRGRHYDAGLSLSGVASEVAGQRDERDVREAIKVLFKKRPSGTEYMPDREAIDRLYPAA